MDRIVAVDATTGQVAEREMTPDENAAMQQLRASVQKTQQDRQAEEALREGTLAQVAQKVGVPVDDLKRALRVGHIPEAIPPDRRPPGKVAVDQVRTASGGDRVSVLGRRSPAPDGPR